MNPHVSAEDIWPDNDAPTLLAAAGAEIRRLRASNAALLEWMRGDASCACCEGVDVCDDECTFAADYPDEAERMDSVRAVIESATKKTP